MMAREILLKMKVEVCHLNELGISMFHKGRLYDATVYFNMAMERMRASKYCGHGSTRPGKSSHVLPTRSCEPLHLNDACFYGMNWQLVTSLALMYNAALVHFKAGAFDTSSHLLNLALGMMKKELNPTELHKLLSTSKFAVTVITALYIVLGKSLAVSNNKIQAKHAYETASGLMRRYSQRVIKNTKVSITKAKQASLTSAALLLSLRNPVSHSNHTVQPACKTTAATAC